jgi:hypothetical protein
VFCILNEAYYVTNIDVKAKIKMEYAGHMDTSHRIWEKSFGALTLALQKIKFTIKPSRDPDLGRDLRLGATGLDFSLLTKCYAVSDVRF